jgi:hypothetical protein
MTSSAPKGKARRWTIERLALVDNPVIRLAPTANLRDREKVPHSRSVGHLTGNAIRLLDDGQTAGGCGAMLERRRNEQL